MKQIDVKQIEEILIRENGFLTPTAKALGIRLTELEDIIQGDEGLLSLAYELEESRLDALEAELSFIATNRKHSKQFMAITEYLKGRGNSRGFGNSKFSMEIDSSGGVGVIMIAPPDYKGDDHHGTKKIETKTETWQRKKVLEVEQEFIEEGSEEPGCSCSLDRAEKIREDQVSEIGGEREET